MTIENSGQYESQLRAQRTLSSSCQQRWSSFFAAVRRVSFCQGRRARDFAVPFALTGGRLSPVLLGYNSAGGVGRLHRALRHGDSDRLVMVVYLEEMLKEEQAERGADSTAIDCCKRQDGRGCACAEGDDVATIVAACCPSCGHAHGRRSDEAAGHAGIGGMLSSLVHILIVTPVILRVVEKRELNSKSKFKSK